MTTVSDAKQAAVMNMLSGWEASNRLTQANLNAYFRAVADVSLQAAKRACAMYADGRVSGHDMAYMPSAAQVSAKAREFDEIKGTIIAEEQIELISYPIGGKPPPGYMGLGEYDERRKRLAEVDRPKIAAAKAPKLKRMTDK